MGRVVHFELFDEQPQRLVDFYRAAFGWDISTWGGPDEYYLATTGPQEDVGINGAITPFGSAGRQPVVLTIDVENLGEAIASVIAAGGEAVSERQEIPGVGTFAYMRDPGGLVFGIMQASEEAAAGASWDEVGERLRELGASLARVVGESTSSPQAKRVREEADRAAASVREAGRQAADRARPHIVAALDRVSSELDQLAARLRGSEQDVVEQPNTPSEGADEGPASGDEDIQGPEESRPLA